jgi:hypothetical protein
VFKYTLHESEKPLFSAIRKTHNEENLQSIYAYRFEKSLVSYLQVKSIKNKTELDTLFFLVFITSYLFLLLLFYNNPFVCIIIHLYPVLIVSIGYTWLSQFPRPRFTSEHRKKLNLENYLIYCDAKNSNPNQELNNLVIFYNKVWSNFITISGLVFFSGLINALNENKFFDNLLQGCISELWSLSRFGTISFFTLVISFVLMFVRFYAPLVWCKRMIVDLAKIENQH